MNLLTLLRPEKKKSGYKVAVPSEIRQQIYDLADEGMLQKDIATELGVEGATVSRYLSARRNKLALETGNGQPDHVPVDTLAQFSQFQKFERENQKYQEEQAAKSEDRFAQLIATLRPPSRGDGFLSAEDKIEQKKADLLDKLNGDPEVEAALLLQLKEEILGRRADPRKSPIQELLAQMKEMRDLETTLGIGKGGKGDDSLMGMVREVLPDILKPVLIAIGSQMLQQRPELVERIATTQGLLTPGATETETKGDDQVTQPTADQGTRVEPLMGLFYPADVADVLDYEDATDAADATWELFYARYMTLEESARELTSAQFIAFLTTPAILVRMKLGEFANNPVWAAAIKSLTEREDKTWFDEYRKNLLNLYQAAVAAQKDADPADQAGDDAEVE